MLRKTKIVDDPNESILKQTSQGLHRWRDKVAREEDESTGYILPNKALLEIARQMPISAGKLRRLVRSNHSFVERHLNTIITIIRSSIENSSAFEAIAEELKQAQPKSTKHNKEEAGDNSELTTATEDPVDSTSSRADVSDVTSDGIMQISGNIAASMESVVKPANTQSTSDQIVVPSLCQQDGKLQAMLSSKIECPNGTSGAADAMEKEKRCDGSTQHINPTKNVSTVAVQVAKKSSSSFGALLGNSCSRRKLNPVKEDVSDQVKNVNKVELIKSSVTLPFFTFKCQDNPSEPNHVESINHPQPETPQQWSDQPSKVTKLEDVILLENDESDSSKSPSESPTVNDDAKGMEFDHPPLENTENAGCQLDLRKGKEVVPLSDLSSSFQQCFQPISQRKGGSKMHQKQTQEPEPIREVKPFDYAAARKNVEFGGTEACTDGTVGEKNSESGDKRKGLVKGRDGSEERVKGLRRQAFPPSGNRTTTYK